MTQKKLGIVELVLHKPFPVHLTLPQAEILESNWKLIDHN